MDKFYLVWEPSSGYTKYRHSTQQHAEQEAERLARENPNKQFHVLTSLGFCYKNDISWQRPKEEIPVIDLKELPF
jgi:hypothetical protein